MPAIVWDGPGSSPELGMPSGFQGSAIPDCLPGSVSRRLGHNRAGRAGAVLLTWNAGIPGNSLTYCVLSSSCSFCFAQKCCKISDQWVYQRSCSMSRDVSGAYIASLRACLPRILSGFPLSLLIPWHVSPTTFWLCNQCRNKNVRMVWLVDCYCESFSFL